MKNIICLALIAILMQSASVLFAQSQGQGLSTIVVESDPLDGTSKKGYIVNKPTNTGPWAEKPILDTPYSINIITSDFINNIQAQQPDDVLKRVPHVHPGLSYVNIFSNYSTRGIWGAARDIINGVQVDNSGLGIFVENVESMDIMTGLSGFMYGSLNIGGTINYNLKKPTYSFVNKVKLGYIDGQLSANIDSGGPIIPDKLAYRLNFVHQDGHTAIKNQEKRKLLAYGALDWRITDNLDLLLFGSYGEYRQYGRQTVFLINSIPATGMRAPLDPTVSWTTGDSFHDLDTFFYGANLKFNLDDKFKLRLGYMHKEADRKTLSSASSFIGNTDNYSFVITAINWDYRSDGYSAYADVTFDTFSITHNLTVGTSGYIYERYDGMACNPLTGYCGNTFAFSQANFSSMIPLYSNYNIPAGGMFSGSFLNNSIANNVNAKGIPFWSIYNGKHLTTKHEVTNLTIGDDIKINDQWGLMLGLNQSRYTTKSFHVRTGALTNQTNATTITPTLAISFKPTPEVTTYASYVEALDNMTQVPANYINGGEILSPTVSKQYEIGAKAVVGDKQVTLALFQIDRATILTTGTSPNQYMSKNGMQRHRGMELAFRGRFADSLNILSGLTLIDAKRIRTDNGTLDGKRPITTPKVLGKLYFEYDLPFIDGLTMTGGVFHTGSVAVNTANTVFLPSVTTGDFGLRYTAKIFDSDAIFRFDMTNVTNKAYWGFVATEITIGPPRTLTLTGEMVF